MEIATLLSENGMRHISVIRNPLIARVLNELGLIEAWATGIQIAQQELATGEWGGGGGCVCGGLW